MTVFCMMSKEDIVFPKSDRQPLFEAMERVNNKLSYATKKSVGDQRKVVQLILQSDGRLGSSVLKSMLYCRVMKTGERYIVCASMGTAFSCLINVE